MSNLQPYLDQLLKDIQQASRLPAPTLFPKHGDKSFASEMQEVESVVTHEGWQNLGTLFGLEVDMFPPADLLSEEQRMQVINAFHDMLNSQDISADITRKVPSSMAYKLLVGLLKEEVLVGHGGFNEFDFCTGTPEGCELEQFCQCLKFYEDEK